VTVIVSGRFSKTSQVNEVNFLIFLSHKVHSPTVPSGLKQDLAGVWPLT